MRHATRVLLGTVIPLFICSSAEVPAAATNELMPGEIYADSISQTNRTNFYSFYALSNDSVTIAVYKTNDLGLPFFALYRPGVRPGDPPLIRDENLGELGFVEDFRIPQDGTYNLQVRDQGNDESFDYQLSFIIQRCGVNARDDEADRDDPLETNQLGQLSHGRIKTNVDFDTYCFSARSNDLLTVNLYGADYGTNGQAWPTFRIYSPTGTFLTNDFLDVFRGNSKAFVQDVRLTNDGMYLLVVRGEGVRGPFDYDFSVVTIPSTNYPILKPGEPVSGSVLLADLDVYRFDVICGESITLNLERTGGTGQPYLWLYGPGPSNLDNGFSSITRHNLAAGTYTVVVRDRGHNQQFDYTLTLLTPPIVHPPIGSRPWLGIVRCSGNILLRWHTNFSGFIVETATECSTQANLWTPVTTQPYDNGTLYYINQPATNRMQFYRLRCTNCPSGQ